MKPQQKTSELAEPYMRDIVTTWPDTLLNGVQGRAAVFRTAARRERSHRIFAAIQAVVGMTVILKADGPGDGCLTQLEEAFYEADWLWSRNPYNQRKR